MNSNIMNRAMEALYYSFQNKKKKERFDIILEPLQAIIQISFLSQCPPGTKLAIHNNILYLQQPTYSQGVVRWYNSDTKEDLFYLFNVFCRFNKFYDHLKDDSTTRELYFLIIEMAKKGINKLTRTYNETDKVSLLHTLQMYKTMLDNPDLLNKKSEQAHLSRHEYKGHESDDEITSQGDNEKSRTNIDDIFGQITSLYSPEHIQIIYNTLLLCNNNSKNNNESYIDGLNKILEPVNITIKKWIDENLVI